MEMLRDRLTPPTAAQCREYADNLITRSREAGISQKRATVLVNIARSLKGIASQLDILAADDAKPVK
jgi:hypothetical protein